jgi:hypothetical protein
LVPKIKAALFETGIDLAEVIQSSLMTKENLKTADEQYSRSTTPVGVDRNTPIVCPEILGWLSQYLLRRGQNGFLLQSQTLILNIRQILNILMTERDEHQLQM